MAHRPASDPRSWQPAPSPPPGPTNHRAAAWGYLQLGDLQEQLGHPADARRAFADAAQLFTMLGALDGQREVHVREAMLQTVD